MKKMFAVAATAALMLAASSPALAYEIDVVGDENIVTYESVGDSTEYNAIAQNIIGSIGDVNQTQNGVALAGSGDATAVSDDESVSVADSSAEANGSQSQDFTFVQYNSALNDF